MTKNTLKYLGAAGLIVLIGFATLQTVRYLQYKNSPERQREEFVKAWEKAYREDTYGGITPEETLQLFIDALKKGDTDLAAKYFIIDDQQKNRESLARVKERGMLNSMVKDLEREKYKYQISDGQIAFDIANDEKEIALTILLSRGPNGKWKILDF